MITNVKITITGDGSIPGEIKHVIADMIHDYLVEQGILIGEPQQTDFFDGV